MKITLPSHEILQMAPREIILKGLELFGRTCYKSEQKITEQSASGFVRSIVGSGHLSVIEHFSITVRFICDRGVSHELVRHRIASYSQESTRYVDYKGKDIEFILPYQFHEEYSYPFNENLYILWYNSCVLAEKTYKEMRELGASPQLARSILPNSLKTEIVVTANLREWRHIFRLRCANSAHPDMRILMEPLREELQKLLPEVFKGEHE